MQIVSFSDQKANRGKQYLHTGVGKRKEIHDLFQKIIHYVQPGQLRHKKIRLQHKKIYKNRSISPLRSTDTCSAKQDRTVGELPDTAPSSAGFVYPFQAFAHIRRQARPCPDEGDWPRLSLSLNDLVLRLSLFDRPG